MCGLALLFGTGEAAAQSPSLKTYKVDPNQISVSGISSGASLAHQLHIAYSSVIRGAGLLAAAPYACAKGNLNRAMQVCSSFISPYQGPPDVNELVQLTRSEFQAKHIDDPANLADDRVYLFRGAKDRYVPESAMDQVQQYYIKMGVRPENIFYQKTVPADHAMVTADYGNACDAFGSPYINNCGNQAPADADTAGILLQQIYGNLVKPNASPPQGQMLEFSQAEFVADPAKISMDTVGHVYVPNNCASGTRCKLHIAIHGCEQNDDQIQSAFYTHAGYNFWADANDIIVIYPQVQKSPTTPYNPSGCWDWWGYTNQQDYYRKSGKQMAAVRAMIARVTGENGGPPVVTCENPRVSGNSVTLGCSASGARPIASYHIVITEPSPKDETLPGGPNFSKQYANLADGQYTAEVTATDDQDQDSVPDIKPFSIPSDKVCFTETNGTHVTAGRAHRCGFFNLFYCANGSNDALGFFQGTTTSLQQTAPGNWTKVPGC